MDKQTARHILEQQHGSLKVSSVYDDVPEVAEAIVTLVGDFEYPEWSYRSLKEVLRATGITQCPFCTATRTRCPECGKEHRHGEAAMCEAPACQEMNAPLDCVGCGRTVHYNNDGVLDIDSSLRKYKR